MNAKLPAFLLVVVASAGLTGCLGFLKPAQATARSFVLTPMPAPERAAEPTAATSRAAGIGVGPVRLPAYLLNTSLAVRQGTNEIEYPPLTLWAERLDANFQRVVAANLAILLPTDRVRLSAWRTEEVAAEVQVAVEQFDLDANGRGVLVAWWRVSAPGGEETLQSGQSRLTRAGPPPMTDPSGAVATLSELVGDLSRELARAIQGTAYSRPSQQ